MIRLMEYGDIDYVIELEKNVLNTTLGEAMLEDCIYNPYKRAYVYTIFDEIVGYISTMFDGYDVEILNFCVYKSYQNKKIGRELLNYALSYFYSKNAISAFLEVRESNLKAIHIYELFGFKKINVRKNYYSNNENAIVMQKTFIPYEDIENMYLDCYVKRQKGKDYVKVFNDNHETKYYHNYYIVNEKTNLLPLLAEPFCGFNHFVSNNQIKHDLDDYSLDRICILHSNINSIKILSKNNKKVSRLNDDNISLIRDFIYNDSLVFGEEYAKRNVVCLVDADYLYHKINVYVVFDSDKVVGYLHTYIYKNYAKIEDFFVLDDYQRNGYGSSLFNKAIEDLKMSGCTDVILDCDMDDTPLEMYKRMGFNIISKYYMYFKRVEKYGKNKCNENFRSKEN